jgi:hypothetical protein
MPPLPKDKMPEAEVSLRFAFYLLSNANSSGHASIAIDGAHVRCGGQVIFPIVEFLNEMNWQQIEQIGGNDWHGTYEQNGKQITIHSNPGRGDVVTSIGQRTVRAECKGGPLIQRDGSPEYPIIREALGQLLTVEQITETDIYVVAVPKTPRFQSLIDNWRTRPLIEKTQIRFALVDRSGTVDGLDLTQ